MKKIVLGVLLVLVAVTLVSTSFVMAHGNSPHSVDEHGNSPSSYGDTIEETSNLGHGNSPGDFVAHGNNPVH